LAARQLGVQQLDEAFCLVSFMQHEFGYFDPEQKTLQPLYNPFGARLSPMASLVIPAFVSNASYPCCATATLQHNSNVVTLQAPNRLAFETGIGRSAVRWYIPRNSEGGHDG
jgi:hypothetical protein